MSDIYQRKRDHIDLCHTGDVHPGVHWGLFEEFDFVHNAMPELAMAELDLSTTLLDHELSAPLMVTGMTGGPSEAGRINREIASVCDEMGLAFGVGSQRVILRADEAVDSFLVRNAAPNLMLFGNIGINQARDLGAKQVSEFMSRIEANYMAIHLNPAMELVQPGAEADSDFRSGYETVGRLVDALDGRLIVKECGSGLSPSVVARLKSLGVRAVDVSGSGGTSWVKVEALRASGQQAILGHEFENWGIPTAAATGLAARVGGVEVISSGGISGGLTAAKAIALGATVAGCARPVLQAYLDEGREGAHRALSAMVGGIKMAMALTGCRSPAELVSKPRVLGSRLSQWLEQVPATETR